MHALISHLLLDLGFFFLFFVSTNFVCSWRRDRERLSSLRRCSRGGVIRFALHTPRVTGYVCTPLPCAFSAMYQLLIFEPPPKQSVCMRFMSLSSIAYVCSLIFNASFNILSLNLLLLRFYVRQPPPNPNAHLIKPKHDELSSHKPKSTQEAGSGGVR